MEPIFTTETIKPLPYQDYFTITNHFQVRKGDSAVPGEDENYESDEDSLKDNSYDVYQPNEIGHEKIDQFSVLRYWREENMEGDEKYIRQFGIVLL